jgi:hypothetical protein
LIHDFETNLKQKAQQGTHQKDLDWSTAHDLLISTKAIGMILHLWVLLVQLKKGDNVEKLVKNRLPVLIWENPTCLSLTSIPNQKHSALIVGRLTHPPSNNNNNSLFLSLGTCIW